MCCRVRIVFVLLVATVFLTQSQCKSVKRSQNEITNPTTKDLTPKTTAAKSSKKVSPPSAILAIEIIDPKENSTGKSKNSKRTAASQLGYGYQENNSFGVSNKPQLVYYKYSQRDIPAYQSNPYYTTGRGQDTHVQKSIEYDLGNGQEQQQNSLVQYYQPGTTLFTTLNHNGQVNQLSAQVPQQSVSQNVPVVYLRIYSDQLTNNALYPNIPANHPQSNLNGVNLQSLLSNYLHNVQPTYSDYPQQDQQTYQQSAQTYQQDQQTYQQSAQTYQQDQQIYQQPGQTYQQDQNRDYYINQPITYQQNYQDQASQYQQYQQPQQVAQAYHQQASADDLPTHENYPDDAHTRVIFHSNNGGHFPEKPQAPNTVPSVNSYHIQHPHVNQIPPAQSYSSFEFKPSLPDYSRDHHQEQQQADQGYYYYKPAVANYYVQNGLQGYQSQSSEQTSREQQQDGDLPYNYHAHPASSNKRDVRRQPAIVSKKIAKIKLED